MTREEAKKRLEIWLKCVTCPEDKQCYDSNLKSICEYIDYCEETPLDDAIRVAIEALKTLEEFEKAQIITGGRLNGRTYAYKCGLEDGKRKALEQDTVPFDFELYQAGLMDIPKEMIEVLDKIRAEIEQNAYPIVHGVNNHELGMTLYGILQIIDKYRADSEDKP